MRRHRLRRILLVLAALPVLAAAVVVAINLDDPGVEALPDRPTTLPPRPAPPGPEDSRTLDPADIHAALLTAEEIEELLAREADRPPTPTPPPPDPDAPRYTHDGFGGLITVEQAAQGVRPLAPDAAVTLFTSLPGVTFEYPSNWTVVEEPQDIPGVTKWRIQNVGPDEIVAPAHAREFVAIEVIRSDRLVTASYGYQSADDVYARLQAMTPLAPGVETFEFVDLAGHRALRHFTREAVEHGLLTVSVVVDGELHLFRTWPAERYGDVFEELLDSVEFGP